jgi:hypothetical protein
MTEKKTKVVVAGLLVLCLLSLLWEDYGEKVIGLTELVAASGAWFSAVWLWKGEWSVPIGRGGRRLVAFMSAVVRGTSILLMIAGTGVVLYSLIFASSIGKTEAGKMLFIGFGIQAFGYLPFYILLWFEKKKRESQNVVDRKLVE